MISYSIQLYINDNGETTKHVKGYCVFIIDNCNDQNMNTMYLS